MENEKPIYVVSCTETDRDGVLTGTSVRLEVVGLYSTLPLATAVVNKQLLKMKDKIASHYETLLREIQEEICQTINELATEKDPATQEILRFTIERLEERQRLYETNKVPETFIGQDESGELNEITCRDDSLGWICAFDIQKMRIN